MAYCSVILRKSEFIVSRDSYEVGSRAARENSHVRFFRVPRQMAVKEFHPPHRRGGYSKSTY